MEIINVYLKADADRPSAPRRTKGFLSEQHQFIFVYTQNARGPLIGLLAFCLPFGGAFFIMSGPRRGVSDVSNLGREKVSDVWHLT
jgi:hypothetical protein